MQIGFLHDQEKLLNVKEDYYISAKNVRLILENLNQNKCLPLRVNHAMAEMVEFGLWLCKLLKKSVFTVLYKADFN